MHVGIGTARPTLRSALDVGWRAAPATTTRAKGPQPRIQLRSAQSWHTFERQHDAAVGCISRICCDGCQTRARTYGATRRSNSISTALGWPGVDAERVGEHVVADRLLRRERLLLERHRGDAIDRERADVLVFGHVGQQIQPALRERQPIRMDHVVLRPARSTPSDSASWRRGKCSVASSSRATMSGDDVAAAARGPGLAARTDGRRSRNCRIRGDSIFSRRAKALRQIALERCAGDRFEQVAAQIQRAHFGEREAGLEPFQHLAVEAPARAPVLVALVVQRKAGLLQRRRGRGGSCAS